MKKRIFAVSTLGIAIFLLSFGSLALAQGGTVVLSNQPLVAFFPVSSVSDDVWIELNEIGQGGVVTCTVNSSQPGLDIEFWNGDQRLSRATQSYFHVLRHSASHNVTLVKVRPHQLPNSLSCEWQFEGTEVLTPTLEIVGSTPLSSTLVLKSTGITTDTQLEIFEIGGVYTTTPTWVQVENHFIYTETNASNWRSLTLFDIQNEVIISHPCWTESEATGWAEWQGCPNTTPITPTLTVVGQTCSDMAIETTGILTDTQVEIYEIGEVYTVITPTWQNLSGSLMFTPTNFATWRSLSLYNVNEELSVQNPCWKASNDSGWAIWKGFTTFLPIIFK